MPPPPRGRRPAAAPAAGVSSRPSAAGVRGHVSRATPRRTPFGRGVRRSFAFFVWRACRPRRCRPLPAELEEHVREAPAQATHESPTGCVRGQGCSSQSTRARRRRSILLFRLSLAALHVGAFVWNELAATTEGVTPQAHTIRYSLLVAAPHLRSALPGPFQTSPPDADPARPPRPSRPFHLKPVPHACVILGATCV